MAALDEVLEGGAAVLGGAREHVEQRVVGDGKAGGERLGRRRAEFVEGGLVPVDEVVLWRLAFDEAALLVRIAGGLGFEFEVLDDMFGRLGNHIANGIEAAAAGAAADLAEVPGAQNPGATAVVFAQPGEHHRADRHVDADAQCVGAANHLEQARPGQLFYQEPVFRQESRVVDADAVAQDLGQFAAVGAAEIGVVKGAGDGGLFLLAAIVGGQQVARGLGACVLGEVDQIDRCPAGLHEFGHLVLQQGGGVGKFQRHRALVGVDEGGRRFG